MTDIKQSCLLFVFLFLIFNNLVLSQELSPEKQIISNKISDYFLLERESIHLHLDKNIFLSNEEIWFKGYVFDRKNNVPYSKTTNIYASILNKDGIKISQKLLFCKDGTFSGSFKLNKNYESGNYYIQIYTNWMNNFIEDESFVSKISIVNEKDSNYSDSKNINYSKIQIEFNAESNSFIEGIGQNIGVKITDCNGNPIKVEDAEIFNSKNEPITLFKTNRFGFGKFYLNPKNEKYKAIVSLNNKKIEAFLPNVEISGLSLEVNNNSLENKTIVKVKTNELTLNSIIDKKFIILIQQDQKSYFFDVDFKNNKLEQSLIFSNEYLYDGVNSIKIIDEQNKLYAERLVYNFEDSDSKSEIFIQAKTNIKQNLAGKTNLKNANISLSLLPENTISCNDLTDIYASFLLNPYLQDKIKDGKYFFNETTRLKKYELDLMLLNQKAVKYNWYNILNNTPKNNFEFDNGVNIKGSINQVVSKRENYNIKAYSISSQILKLAEINAKDEFYFKNLIVPDSSKVNFSLVSLPDFISTTPLKYYAQIENKIRNFNKKVVISENFCDTISEIKSKIELPKLKKYVTLLSEVEIKAKKNKLQYDNAKGNSSLRGFKISDLEGNMDVLDYINIKGFEVNKRLGEVSVSLRIRGLDLEKQREAENFIQTDQTAVFINDFTIGSLNELSGIQMTEVDEIYIGSGVANPLGIIKIYLKKPKPRKVYTNSFLISGGFELIKDFKNQDYASTFDKGFENFGVINFNKDILTDENGFFQFDIPNFNQKSIKILIEGFDNDGKLISEIKTLQLE